MFKAVIIEYKVSPVSVLFFNRRRLRVTLKHTAKGQRYGLTSYNIKITALLRCFINYFLL